MSTDDSKIVREAMHKAEQVDKKFYLTLAGFILALLLNVSGAFYFMGQLTNQIKGNTTRISTLETQHVDTTVKLNAISVLNSEIGHIRDDITEIKSEVKQINRL